MSYFIFNRFPYLRTDNNQRNLLTSYFMKSHPYSKILSCIQRCEIQNFHQLTFWEVLSDSQILYFAKSLTNIARFCFESLNFFKITITIMVVVFVVGCSDSSPKISVSTVSGNMGGDGLLKAKGHGWHSSSPPSYPEFIQLDLGRIEKIGYIGMLPQEGYPQRFSKAISVDISDDGKIWKPIAGSDNMCKPNMPDGWTNLSFAPQEGRYVKVYIYSNCDNGHFLTIRGFRFGS